jgi:iron complex transport system substrate-binding protein
VLLSRRRLLTLAAGAGVLAACADDDASPAPPAADAGGDVTSAVPAGNVPPESTAAADGFPRTVGRDFATATIEARPTRVVATADRDQLDVLLAMGLAPAMYGRSGDYDTVAPWIDAVLVAGVEAAPMPGSFEPNLEAIAAARPDLIVDAWAEPSVHKDLSQIAPTIQVKLDNTDSWQAAQRLAGAATGREEAAELAIAETEAVLAAQAGRLVALAGLSVAVAFIDAAELVMIPGNEIGGRVFTELGLHVHPTPDGSSGRYSIEDLAELLGDADVIVSFDYGSLEGQEANPLFMQLPAVAAGRYVRLDVDTATACYQESTLSVRWAAGRVADALLA